MKNKGSVKISAIIIARNDEEIITGCLKSLLWCNEIVVIDSGSIDKTAQIARKYGAEVYKYKGGNFSDWRNEGLKRSKSEWILYVDTDERVTPELKDEIINLLKSVSDNKDHDSADINSYAVPRRNIILGREMKHGGWWPDYVKRLFRKNALKNWTGELHEEPVYEGVMGYLKNHIIHIKENNLSDMVEKTNRRSEIEAKLMFEAGHPDMNLARFFSAIFREFWHRFIQKKAFLDGAEGVIFGIYQVYSRFISYAKLWEMQNTGIESRKIKTKSTV